MATATLKISSNLAFNNLTLDLSNYIIANDDSLDPASPSFTDKVISHSLLKTGGVLALTDMKNKELVFPLIIGPFSTYSAMATELIQINQVLESPSATASWQDTGLSQATTFDLIGGQLDVEYNYRRAQAYYTNGKLRLFAQPLGRTTGREYATASGYGPVLFISPYASNTTNILGASTQNSISGYGGRQIASGGVFYWGSPSLAGDAPALLQVSYLGPVVSGASGTIVPPYLMVSTLPDPYYRPLITAAELNTEPGYTLKGQAGAVNGQYISPGQGNGFAFQPMSSLAQGGSEPAGAWGGQHRIFAIARASAAYGELQMHSGTLVPNTTTATVNPGSWGFYDLGPLALTPSENVSAYAVLVVPSVSPAPSLDITALVMLPESSTWFFNPTTLTASQYGVPFTNGYPYGFNTSNYSNLLMIDDYLGDQFLYGNGPSTAQTPPPFSGLTTTAQPITSFTRGVVPQPDPKYGMPIIAITAIPQWSTYQNQGYGGVFGQSVTNNLGLGAMAQVNVYERARYVLP